MDTPILECRGLTKTFGGYVAVDRLDISVRPGTIHAIIGPNGAGKTTCFNLITKTLLPSNGTIKLDGVDITRLGPAQVAQRGLVRSFQISAVFPQLSAIDNVLVALQRRHGFTFKFWRRDCCIAPFFHRAEEILDQVGLLDYRDEPASQLSYGRKKILDIATTLALDPRILLLDEPMAGLGLEDIAHVATLIRDTARTCTVVMIEHNMSVVADLSTTITVLQRGCELAEGDYATVSSNLSVIEAYVGASHETAH